MYIIEKTITKTSSRGKVFTCTRTITVRDKAEWDRIMRKRRRRIRTYGDEFADLYTNYARERELRKIETRVWEDQVPYELDPMYEIRDRYEEYVHNVRDFRY